MSLLLLYDVGVCLVLFFFFKQKTAYEMRISDWSSDVCSSDLSRIASHAGSRSSRFASTASSSRARKRRRRVRKPRSWARKKSTASRLAPAPFLPEMRSSPRARTSSHSAVRRLARCTAPLRSEEHTSELQSLMRISYAVFCLKKKNTLQRRKQNTAYKRLKTTKNTTKNK